MFFFFILTLITSHYGASPAGVTVHWTNFELVEGAENAELEGIENAQYETSVGGNGGSAFTQDCVHKKGIKSFEMECGSRPGSIQITCGDNSQFGKSGAGLGHGNGSFKTYTPPNVNGISKVEIRHGSFVNSVKYFSGTTQVGATCGNPTGSTYVCNRPSADYRLCGLKGRAGWWMDQLQCGWCKYEDSNRFCKTTAGTEGGNQACINFLYWRGDGNICGPCNCSGCPLMKRNIAWCRKTDGTKGGNQLCIDIKYNENPSQNICGPCGCSGCPIVVPNNKWCRKTDGSAGGNQDCIDWLQHQNPSQNTCGPCGCSGCPLLPRTKARCRKEDGGHGGNQDCIDYMYNQDPTQNICGPCGCSGCPLFLAPNVTLQTTSVFSGNTALFAVGGVLVAFLGIVGKMFYQNKSDYQMIEEDINTV